MWKNFSVRAENNNKELYVSHVHVQDHWYQEFDPTEWSIVIFYKNSSEETVTKTQRMSI